MTSFETDKNTTEIEAILDKQRVQAITAFMQALKCGQKNGEINLSLNPRTTAKLLTTLLQGAQCDIRYGAMDEDIMQLRESIREILKP